MDTNTTTSRLDDGPKIRATVADYQEGWYTADAARSPTWTTPMTKFVHVFAWLAILSTAHAQTLNLAPSYDALEAGPGYSRVGKATIKPLSDTAYDIEWNFDGEVVKGFGMRFNDMLACTFTYGNEPGLVVYKIEGSLLDGVWAVRHGLGTGTERLTPSK